MLNAPSELALQQLQPFETCGLARDQGAQSAEFVRKRDLRLSGRLVLGRAPARDRQRLGDHRPTVIFCSAQKSIASLDTTGLWKSKRG